MRVDGHPPLCLRPLSPSIILSAIFLSGGLASVFLRALLRNLCELCVKTSVPELPASLVSHTVIECGGWGVEGHTPLCLSASLVRNYLAPQFESPCNALLVRQRRYADLEQWNSRRPNPKVNTTLRALISEYFLLGAPQAHSSVASGDNVEAPGRESSSILLHSEY